MHLNFLDKVATIRTHQLMLERQRRYVIQEKSRRITKSIQSGCKVANTEFHFKGQFRLLKIRWFRLYQTKVLKFAKEIHFHHIFHDSYGSRCCLKFQDQHFPGPNDVSATYNGQRYHFQFLKLHQRCGFYNFVSSTTKKSKQLRRNCSQILNRVFQFEHSSDFYSQKSLVLFC